MASAAQAKEPLSRQAMADRIAMEFQDGWVVNLGIGIPTLCSNYKHTDREIIFQSENGVIGYGSLSPEGEEDPHPSKAEDHGQGQNWIVGAGHIEDEARQTHRNGVAHHGPAHLPAIACGQWSLAEVLAVDYQVARPLSSKPYAKKRGEEVEHPHVLGPEQEQHRRPLTKEAERHDYLGAISFRQNRGEQAAWNAHQGDYAKHDRG